MLIEMGISPAPPVPRPNVLPDVEKLEERVVMVGKSWRSSEVQQDRELRQLVELDWRMETKRLALARMRRKREDAARIREVR
jgi:hypothetical protein